MDNETALTFLSASRTIHLATSGSDWRPHVVTICFVLSGDVIYSPLDEKPKRVGPIQLRRVRNIIENPIVSLVADRYDDLNWERLAYVLVEGKASILNSGDEHGNAVRLLRNKYFQYRTMRLEERPIIKIVVNRIVSWGDVTT